MRTFLDRITDDPQLNQADFYELRKRLLESAKPFYDQLVTESSADAQLMRDRGQFCLRLANVLDELGDYSSSVDYYRAGLAEFVTLANMEPDNPHNRRLLAGAHNDLALILKTLGQFDSAREHHNAALEIREQLVENLEGESSSVQARGDLAESHLNSGQIATCCCGAGFSFKIFHELLAEFERGVVVFRALSNCPSVFRISARSLWAPASNRRL